MKAKIAAIISLCSAMIAGSPLFADTLQVGSASVVVTAGQTVEIPLSSTFPIAGDLTANGAFQPGDVTFIDGPGCHLSAHDCTLLITAARTSRDYTAVPVVVSESGATNTPIFAVSVVHPGEPLPSQIHLPPLASSPVMLSPEEGSGVAFQVKNTTLHPLTDVMAFDLPSGVNSSVCPMIAPGETCTLRLAVNHTPPAGHFVMSIQSDQGVFLDQVLSIRTSAVRAPKPVTALLPVHSSILTSGSLSAVIQPHGTSTAYYTRSSNGPVYQMIVITNHGGSAVTLDIPPISGTDAASFSIDTIGADYSGHPTVCNDGTTLAAEDSCEIIIKSTLGDPGLVPATATLTISDGVGPDTLTFSLADTTYVYAAGGFNILGNASVSGGDLLAECTAGRCSNALQGTTGNNYASANFSVGEWINALAATSTGNLIVGGTFGAIGGASSGATSGTAAALLAQCTPGSVTGNACINQITGTSPYAFNNAYIDAVTAPFSILTTSYVALGGDFSQIRNSSVSSSRRMLAKCEYDGTAASSTCNNYIGVAAISSKYATAAISALDTLGSISGTALVNVGGLFTEIAGYPSSPPSTGTTFASCTSGSSGSCSKSMGSSNPNGSILGMTDDGRSLLYMGGVFTQAGNYNDNSGGYPLVSCTPATPTTCSNALDDSSDANGYIGGLTYSGGVLYVGGRFTTIGGATPVSGGNMLAICTPRGTCSNFVTADAHPYASGTDWGGEISAIAVGNQTSITPS
jgi:hypothetical protein